MNDAEGSPDPLRRSDAEARLAVRCSNCKRQIAASLAEERGWPYWSDGTGELLPFCRECAEREFRA